MMQDGVECHQYWQLDRRAKKKERSGEKKKVDKAGEIMAHKFLLQTCKRIQNPAMQADGNKSNVIKQITGGLPKQ